MLQGNCILFSKILLLEYNDGFFVVVTLNVSSNKIYEGFLGWDFELLVISFNVN